MAFDREVLRKGLCWMAGRRVRATNAGKRLAHLTLDVDSFPVEVHGHQPGSAFNGHYGRTVYHPVVAIAAETGDLIDVKLREGNVHTAEGGLWFIVEALQRAEEALCEKASVRFDAGFPEDELLSVLEGRGTRYVARVINNKALQRLAEPYLKRPVGRPPREPRTWLYEKSYRARDWSCERRVVLVVLERPGELFLHHFWLLTSWSCDEMPAERLLEMYRQRGAAEGRLGELMDVVAPALSSSPRTKRHYAGRTPRRRTPTVDAFEVNEVRLLLSALAYNLMHIPRTVLARVTKEGWSLRRLRERVLRVPGRVVVHARSITLIVSDLARDIWRLLLPELATLGPAG